MIVIRSVTLVLLAVGLALAVSACAVQETITAPLTGAGADAASDPANVKACIKKIPRGATEGQRALAEQTCRDNAEARGAVVEAGTAAATSRVATGAQGDSLKACLKRIPRGASAGQRMIAEESCRRDDAERQAILSAPGR